MEPLHLSFVVDCPLDHAFATWTARTSSWWPIDHTVTAEPRLEVVIEPHVGGRIYERTRDGHEEDWGEVTLWEPLRRTSYLSLAESLRSAPGPTRPPGGSSTPPSAATVAVNLATPNFSVRPPDVDVSGVKCCRLAPALMPSGRSRCFYSGDRGVDPSRGGQLGYRDQRGAARFTSA